MQLNNQSKLNQRKKKKVRAQRCSQIKNMINVCISTFTDKREKKKKWNEMENKIKFW